MRGTCFIASRLAMVAVAGLLCIWWCVVGAAGFFRVFIFIFIFLRTHTACCKYEAASGVIYLSTSMLVWIEATWCAFMYLFVIIILSSRL